MRIPLPDLMRKLRVREARELPRPLATRLALAAYAGLARHNALWRPLTRVASRILALLARRRGVVRRLPGLGAWQRYRELPAPQGDSFQAQWRQHTRVRSGTPDQEEGK